MITAEHQASSEPFPSQSAMSEAHGDLLRRRRGDPPELAGLIRKFIQRGTCTGAILYEPVERSAAQSQIDYWANVLYRIERVELSDTTLVPFDETVWPELRDDQCPYVGLDAFQEDQTSLFFGRSALVREMVVKLGKAPLLAVVGSSGCGKSSAVFAGLLPSLRAGAIAESHGWHFLSPIVPGSKPLTSLASMVAGALGGNEAAQKIETELRRRPDALARTLRRSGLTPAVVTVDQFEEIFTLCTDSKDRMAFINNLTNLVQAPEDQNRVILTMRTDFLDSARRLDSAEFQTVFEQGLILVKPLSRSELQEAIEKPALHVGLVIEPEVVKALVNDFHDEAAALPLLQFTLLKLWQDRERNRIPKHKYDRLGGWQTLLERSADEAFESLDSQDRDAARLVFTNLVEPGTGDEYLRKRMPLTSLHRLLSFDRIDRVVEKLIAARLLHLTHGATAADGQVEVAHEALIRHWGRLRTWLQDDRDNLRWRRRLSEAAEKWNNENRSKDYLWRSAALVGSAQVRDLTEVERKFVRACEKADNDELRRLRAWRVVLVILALLLAMAVVVIVDQNQKLEASVDRSLAMQAKVHFQADPAALQTALLLATESVHRSDRLKPGSQTAIDAAQMLEELLNHEIGYPIRLYEEQDTFEGSAVAMSKDGHWLAAVVRDGSTIYLWDLKSDDPHVATKSFDVRAGQVTALVFSPNQQWLAIGSDTGGGELVSLSSPQRRIQFAVDASPITGLAFSSDGAWLASSTRAGAIRLFRFAEENGGMLDPYILSDSVPDAKTIMFSPDGGWLAVTTENDRLSLWRIADNDEPAIVLDTNKDGVLAFSHDSQWLATASDHSENVLLWDIGHKNYEAALLVLPGHTKGVHVLEFSQDGKWLYAGTGAGTVRLWDIGTILDKQSPQVAETNETKPLSIWPDVPPDQIAGHAGPTLSIALSSPQDTNAPKPVLATTGVTGTVLVLYPNDNYGTPQIIYGHDSLVERVYFGNESRVLVAVGSDGTVRLWRQDTMETTDRRFASSKDLMIQACMAAGRHLNEDEKKLLPDPHAITGCDAISNQVRPLASSP